MGKENMEFVGNLVDAAGVAVIVIGLVVATGWFLVHLRGLGVLES